MINNSNIIANNKIAKRNVISNTSNYIVENLSDNEYRLFRTINGIKTTEYYDCVKLFDQYVVTDESKNKIEDKKMLNINYSYEDFNKYISIKRNYTILLLETELIYCIDENHIIPAQYIYLNYKKEDVSYCAEFLINLNDNKEFNYEEYLLAQYI